MKSMASSFFLLEKINTTEAKAKELRPFVEKFITRAKNPTVYNRRLLAKSFSGGAAKKLIEIAAAVKDRPGGYTRITKIGGRKRDGAKMAILEIIKSEK